MRLKYKDGYKRRRIMRLDELSFEIRLERRTTKGSSSGRIMRLKPIFILETHNQTNYKCLPKFVQKDNASLVVAEKLDPNLTSLNDQQA